MKSIVKYLRRMKTIPRWFNKELVIRLYLKNALWINRVSLVLARRRYVQVSL